MTQRLILLLLLSLAALSIGSQQKYAETQKEDRVESGSLELAQQKEDSLEFEDPISILSQEKLNTSVRQTAAKQAVRDDQVGAVEALFAACQSEPALLLEEVVSYFGEKMHLPAIPMIQKNLEKSTEIEFIASSLFALAKMRDDKTDKYILNACNVNADKKPASYRYRCLLVLHDTENKNLKKKAIPIFEKVEKDPETKKDTKLQKLVVDFLAASWESSAATSSSSPVFPSGPSSSARPARPALKPKPKPIPTPSVVPVPPPISPAPSIPLPSPKRGKGSQKAGTTPSSSKNIHSSLTKSLGSEKATLLLETLDRNLKKYAEQKSDTTEFLVRSYQRYYRKRKLDSAKAKLLMQKGIHYSGSLKAIVKNIKREYREAPVRSYSFSKIFRIPRSQAKLLLNLK